MSILHDMTPHGRLMALLECCKEHKARGDFRTLARLSALIDQTGRAVASDIRRQFDQKQIQPNAPAPRYEEPV